MTATLITVAGTWSPPDAGFQADLARAVTSDWDDIHTEVMGWNGPAFRWVPVPYPASFGPVSPPYPGAPAYVDSVAEGVRNTIAAINNTPGRFVLSGYSQGAEVVGRVCIELANGALQHRRSDCRGCITFGDPARQPEDNAYGGGEGWGISRLRIPPWIDRVTYAVPGDMYCTCPDGQVGDQMHAVYYALTHLGTGRIDGHPALVAEVLRLLRNPITGGIAAVDAIVRALQVREHSNYGPWVPHAVGKLLEMAA